MKKKLLIVLGAGSSIDQGMPSVADLDGHMKTWSEEWLRCDFGMPSNIDNYFTTLWEQQEKYYQNKFLSYQVKPNFERVLGDMMSLAHWMAPPPMGNPVRGIICGDRAPEGLRYHFDRQQAPFGANMMINWQFGYLLIELARHIRKRCQLFNSNQNSFVPYRQIIACLRRQFDVGIYNLNYDNLAVIAWPEASTGFGDNGQFDPDSVHERGEWGFIYHLHGSVHHTLKGNSVSPIYWQKQLDTEFKDGDQGQPINKTTDGKSFPLSTLIAGGFKLDQLLIEPFHSFYAAFASHVYKADAILIGGYGFGDVHVNRTLRNCLEARMLGNDKKRPPVMVLTKSQDGECPMNIRQDNWGIDLQQALLCSHGFECETLDAPRYDGRLSIRSFEWAPLLNVGIWHGGFCETADHLNRITRFLDHE